MSNLICKLDTKVESKNNKEYRYKNRITCDEYGMDYVADGEVVVPLLQRLYSEQNVDINRGLEVRRAGTLVFVIVPIKRWLFPPDNRPDHLKRDKD